MTQLPRRFEHLKDRRDTQSADMAGDSQIVGLRVRYCIQPARGQRATASRRQSPRSGHHFLIRPTRSKFWRSYSYCSGSPWRSPRSRDRGARSRSARTARSPSGIVGLLEGIVQLFDHCRIHALGPRKAEWRVEVPLIAMLGECWHVGPLLAPLVVEEHKQAQIARLTNGAQAGNSTLTMTCPPRIAAAASPPPLPGTWASVVPSLRATSSMAIELSVDGPGVV